MHPHSLSASDPAPGILAEQPAPGSTEQLMVEAIMRLTGLADAMRQTESDRAWASIPSYVTEYGNNPTAGVVVAPPMVGDLVLITRAVVSIPAGTVGTLQLGGFIIPNLQAGVVSLGLGQIMGASDTRTLTLTSGTGPATLVLYGRQLAPTGSMAP